MSAKSSDLKISQASSEAADVKDSLENKLVQEAQMQIEESEILKEFLPGSYTSKTAYRCFSKFYFATDPERQKTFKNYFLKYLYKIEAGYVMFAIRHCDLELADLLLESGNYNCLNMDVITLIENRLLKPPSKISVMSYWGEVHYLFEKHNISTEGSAYNIAMGEVINVFQRDDAPYSIIPFKKPIKKLKIEISEEVHKEIPKAIPLKSSSDSEVSLNTLPGFSGCIELKELREKLESTQDTSGLEKKRKTEEMDVAALGILNKYKESLTYTPTLEQTILNAALKGNRQEVDILSKYVDNSGLTEQVSRLMKRNENSKY